MSVLEFIIKYLARIVSIDVCIYYTPQPKLLFGLE